MAFRFIHTADIHLDSPLRSLALREQALAERIGNATRAAFTRIIDLCIDEQVDALLIAGDLYDGDQTSMKTALFLARELSRLDAAGIRSFIIRGNHDAMSKITAELVLPESATIFGAKAEAISISRPGHADVVVHGISFRDSRAPESLLPRYKAPVEGAINIGLMHTSLGGSPAHDVYAPCNLADLQASGFHYWALGHIHKRAVYSGRATVVMPGIPQGRDINEPGIGSVSLVSITDDGTVTVEERTTALAGFERVVVDLSGEMDWADMVARLGRAMAAPAADGIYRVVRLQLTGTTPLAWRLRREIDLVTTEAAFQAERQGAISIEKVQTDCVPLETKADQGTDAISELGRIIEGDVLASPAFREQAQAAVDDLLKSLPPDLRKIFGQDEDAFAAQLQAMADVGVETVLARLRDADGGGER